MKKGLTIIALILILLLIICCLKKLFKENESSCCSGSVNPTMTIPAKDVIKMIAKYRVERYNVINNGKNFPTLNNYPFFGNYQFNSTLNGEKEFSDSRAITFSIDTIFNFICATKQKMKDNCIDPSVKFTGLRYYYIVYDSSSSFCQTYLKPKYYNVHSVMMMPVCEIGNDGIQRDFDPYYVNKVNKLNNIPINLDSAFFARNLPLHVLMLNTSDTSPEGNSSDMNIQNKGSLCPPPREECKGNGYNLLDAADYIFPCENNVGENPCVQ